MFTQTAMKGARQVYGLSQASSDDDREGVWIGPLDQFLTPPNLRAVTPGVHIEAGRGISTTIWWKQLAES